MSLLARIHIARDTSPQSIRTLSITSTTIECIILGCKPEMFVRWHAHMHARTHPFTQTYNLISFNFLRRLTQTLNKCTHDARAVFIVEAHLYLRKIMLMSSVHFVLWPKRKVLKSQSAPLLELYRLGEWISACVCLLGAQHSVLFSKYLFLSFHLSN